MSRTEEIMKPLVEVELEASLFNSIYAAVDVLVGYGGVEVAVKLVQAIVDIRVGGGKSRKGGKE